MGAFIQNKLLLPIGCSCVNQFQIERSQLLEGFEASAFPFDWAVTSPDSTIRILDNPVPFIGSLDDLEIVNGRVHAKQRPGLFLWHMMHERDGTKDFRTIDDLKPGIDGAVQKHRHLMKKLVEPHDEVHCLWSNIQPNIQGAFESVGVSWSDCVLTEQKYDALKGECARMPWKKTFVWFVCRAADIEPTLIGRDDVLVVECPLGVDSRAPDGLFDPIFRKILAA